MDHGHLLPFIAIELIELQTDQYFEINYFGNADNAETQNSQHTPSAPTLKDARS